MVARCQASCSIHLVMCDLAKMCYSSAHVKALVAMRSAKLNLEVGGLWNEASLSLVSMVTDSPSCQGHQLMMLPRMEKPTATLDMTLAFAALAAKTKTRLTGFRVPAAACHHC
mmetsp:Transcript_17722/g.31617  ORF Transcript_17722/g.31617 Transcript_17722/m.31617 type:complete len:113 (-) Transcript_17722:8-346(-)